MSTLIAPSLKATQAGLFSEEDSFAVQPWRGKALSISKDQGEILRWIMELHNGGQPFECDVTYSKGVFYKHLPQPRLRFDADPQVAGVQKADARMLPLEDNTVASLVFDPPFKASNSKVRGIIEQRFTAFSSVAALWAFYHDALAEFERVLKPDGLCVVKCQDVVSSGKNHFSHFEILKRAEENGLNLVDLFILISTSVLWSPNMMHQRHARKAHSFFLVFRKRREGQ